MKAGKDAVIRCSQTNQSMMTKPTNASFLLAGFVRLKKKSVSVEIGTGSGCVAEIVKKKFPDSTVIGLDIFDEPLHNIENPECGYVCADAKKRNIPFRNNSFHAVICNPPFFDRNSYRPSPVSHRAEARMEISLSFGELLETVRYLLKEKGSFFFIHNSSRIAEITIELYRNNLWIKEMQFVITRKDGPMKLVLIHAKLNSRGETKVLPCIEIV